MNPDTTDIIEEFNLTDGFLIYQNDTGFFLALKTKEQGTVACQKIDKTAYDCMKRREAAVKK